MSRSFTSAPRFKSGFQSLPLSPKARDILVASTALLCLLALPAARADDIAVPAAMAASAPLVPCYAPDAALLDAFGGKDGIFRLAAVFVDKMRTDAKIGHYFEKTKIPQLKTQLGDHLCQLLAGPCVYDGDSMKASHTDMKITKGDSFRQVEILQASMNELNIPFTDQNKLLARLAPMYRDIIER